MTGELFVLILGCALLGIGAVGGGVKVKELEVPSLRKGTRILSGIVGVFLIGLSLLLSPPKWLGNFAVEPTQASIRPAETIVVQAKQPKTIHFSIVDNLGDGQVMEKVEIKLDGKKVGQLEVDGSRTADALRIETEAGADGSDTKTVTLEYVATQGWVGVDQSTKLASTETITVQDNMTYSLAMDYETGEIYLSTDVR